MIICPPPEFQICKPRPTATFWSLTYNCKLFFSSHNLRVSLLKTHLYVIKNYVKDLFNADQLGITGAHDHSFISSVMNTTYYSCSAEYHHTYHAQFAGVIYVRTTIDNIYLYRVWVYIIYGTTQYTSLVILMFAGHLAL